MRKKWPPLAVLIPYSKGVLVYAQTTSKDLRCVLDTSKPREILEGLKPLPPLVALLGDIPWKELCEVILEHTDLCIVPDPWLKHIPRNQRQRRADFTLQLMKAYFGSPIRLIGVKRPQMIPFSTERTVDEQHR
jgi:hypothetical protein